MPQLSTIQKVSLVVLRTLIGWHFAYEGFYKLSLPGWSRTGDRLSAWSAAGYLNAAGGPLADVFRSLADPGVLAWIDVLVPVGLLLVGVSLLLGLATQIGCWGAIAFLTIFYLSAIPTSGTPQPGAEGTYLLVSKNFIELVAAVVVLTFRTGQIAGLDLIVRRRATVSSADGSTFRVPGSGFLFRVLVRGGSFEVRRSWFGGTDRNREPRTANCQPRTRTGNKNLEPGTWNPEQWAAR
jgi:thiosulfate dehydrogenase [quinone] large subunit